MKAADIRSQDTRHAYWRSPLAMLAGAALLLGGALVVTIPVPLGPMYWDQYLYLDAAQRIISGQVPIVDFFAPVGPLGYYLYAGLMAVFPNAQPLFLASWCILLVTIPLMAAVLADVQKRSSATAFALLIPFLLFSVLPFNTGFFYPFPGVDGFGIYNRQACQLLYVLACTLLFVETVRLQTVLIAVAMLSLCLIKITGAVAGGFLCLGAVFTGYLRLKKAVLSAVAFFAALAVLQVTTDIPVAYARDIGALLMLNHSGLGSRLLQAASLNAMIVALGGLLWVLLIMGQRRNMRLLVLLPLFLLAGLLFESQNTGSQAFIFLWPLLLLGLAWSMRERSRHLRTAATVCILAIALPPAVTILQNAARSGIGVLRYETLPQANLRTLGAVRMRSEHLDRAQNMRRFYADHRSTFSALTTQGDLPSFLLFSDIDYQALWLLNADEAVTALYALERQRNLRFSTIMTIDFTNPFAWIMKLNAPKHIAIGADPSRAVPPPDDTVVSAVSAVDIALLPTCPLTTNVADLLSLYQPMLTPNHSRITLTPCFDAFVRNDLLH